MPTDQPVLDALGHRTRRAIVELLADGPRTVGELAGSLPVTRPAVSQHLKVLAGARLVTSRSEGARHVYRLDPEGLAAGRAYLDRFWGQALGSFKQAVERAEQARQEELP